VVQRNCTGREDPRPEPVVGRERPEPAAATPQPPGPPQFLGEVACFDLQVERVNVEDPGLQFDVLERPVHVEDWRVDPTPRLAEVRDRGPNLVRGGGVDQLRHPVRTHLCASANLSRVTSHSVILDRGADSQQLTISTRAAGNGFFTLPPCYVPQGHQAGDLRKTLFKNRIEMSQMTVPKAWGDESPS